MYKFTIHTEDLKGRYEKTETYSRLTEEQAEELMREKCEAIYANSTVFEEYEDGWDKITLVHSCKMQTTLTIEEV